MSEKSTNLLTNLSKWATLNFENFTTDAFVGLLRYLQKHEPQIAGRLLQKMTGGKETGVNLVESGVEQLTFKTREFHNGAIPDIEIAAPGYLILVEVKVSAPLGRDQLKSYRQILEGSGLPKSNTKLVLLSRTRSIDPESLLADAKIRWAQVAEWLKEESVHATSKYVIGQFVEFLSEKGLIIKPVEETTIFKEFERFQKTFSLQLSKSNGEIVDTEALSDYPRLASLLSMMDEIIAAQSKRTLTKRTLDGIKHIGYEIQDSRYCFYIAFHGKECKLVFTTWNCKIDVEKCRNRSGQVVKNAGPVRWQNELNLNRLGDQFFSVTGTAERQIQTQIQIIGEFYRNSNQFAEQIIVEA